MRFFHSSFHTKSSKPTEWLMSLVSLGVDQAHSRAPSPHGLQVPQRMAQLPEWRGHDPKISCLPTRDPLN